MQPSDIAVVKAMKNPPSGVKLVMESVCVMKGIQPERVNDPAGTGKKVLSLNVMSTDFLVHSITWKFKKVEKLIYYACLYLSSFCML